MCSALIIVCEGDAWAQSQSDSKVWAGFAGRFEVNQALRLEAEQEARAGADSGFDKTFTELGLRYEVHRRVRLGAHYRLILVDGRGTWHRVGADVQVLHPVGRLRLSNRLRLQSTARDTDTHTYIRDKVEASYSATKKLEPFTAVELHYLTTNSEFREFRASFGVEVQVTKKADLTAFYMYQSEFNKQIDETNHIFGVGIDYRFRKAPKRRGKRSESEGPVEAMR